MNRYMDMRREGFNEAGVMGLFQSGGSRIV